METKNKIYLMIGSFFVGAGIMSLVYTGELTTIISIICGVFVTILHFNPSPKIKLKDKE